MRYVLLAIIPLFFLAILVGIVTEKTAQLMDQSANCIAQTTECYK